MIKLKRNKRIAQDEWIKLYGIWRKKSAILKSATIAIRNHVKQFVQSCGACDHMITDRMEPTYKCKHVKNSVGTCEWVFCPLGDES